MITSSSHVRPPTTRDARLTMLEQAIDKYHLYLVGYLSRLTRNHADAEDLASELWVYALRNMPVEQFEKLPILRRKAHYLFIDFYRRRMRQGERIELREALNVPSVRHLGKEAYTSAEEQAMQKRFWIEFPVQIPESHREVLWLSARYGFTIKEIAARMGIPQSTVGDWLLRAKQVLADYLRQN